MFIPILFRFSLFCFPFVCGLEIVRDKGRLLLQSWSFEPVVTVELCTVLVFLIYFYSLIRFKKGKPLILILVRHKGSIELYGSAITSK